MINTLAKVQLHKTLKQAHLIPRVQAPETVALFSSFLLVLLADSL
ncbi:MAG: hypothetical protein AAF380_02935 [Bacteroidota bacterium]